MLTDTRRPLNTHRCRPVCRQRGRQQRLARRIGKKKAAVAVGHSILVICWHLLTNNVDYSDLGGDYFARRGDTARHQERLVQQLRDLGYAVTLRKIAA